MLFDEQLKSHRTIKRLAKALIRLRVCAGWSEPLLVADSTLSRLIYFVYASGEGSGESVHMHRLTNSPEYSLFFENVISTKITCADLNIK